MQIKKLKSRFTKFLTPINIFIATILAIALFVRVYRIDQLMGFYYDQGRDGLVIWEFLHNKKLFLIGPTTGIEGIFRGPWYYWLITPFYALGRGNPVFPSVFLSFTTVLASYFVFKIAEKIGGKVSGILALVISSMSFYLVLTSRWLSNPTPMFLISVLLIYSLFLIYEGKKYVWIAVGFLLGMAMQFGSAAEVFYFPAVFIFWLTNKKLRPDFKTLTISIGLILLTFVPQVAFDIKHGGILRDNIYKFIFAEGSFKATFWEMVKIRLPFYFDVFFSKIIQSHTLQKLFAMTALVLLVIQRKKLFSSRYFQIVFIFLISPLIGMLFFQGNHGNVYDYYFTGYYLIFILIFSIVIGSYWENVSGKILIVLFLYIFLRENVVSVKNYIVSGVDGPTTIALGNEVQAVEWIHDDAKDSQFNIDVYVPPVIPHAYNYIFKWKANINLIEQNIPLLYTLYEVDTNHPERLKAWLARQNGIGRVIYSEKFGGITIERRERFK